MRSLKLCLSKSTVCKEINYYATNIINSFLTLIFTIFFVTIRDHIKSSISFYSVFSKPFEKYVSVANLKLLTTVLNRIYIQLNNTKLTRKKYLYNFMILGKISGQRLAVKTTFLSAPKYNLDLISLLTIPYS